MDVSISHETPGSWELYIKLRPGNMTLHLDALARTGLTWRTQPLNQGKNRRWVKPVGRGFRGGCNGNRGDVNFQKIKRGDKNL